MSGSTTDHTGTIYQAFKDVTYHQDAQHPLIKYITSDNQTRQSILNDPRTHSVLVVAANYRITVVSLPEYRIDMMTGRKTLLGFLGFECSMTSPVSLRGNFATDVIEEVPDEPQAVR